VEKICDTSNFKKAIDKLFTKRYNGIVNSNGAEDDIVLGSIFLVSANSIHKGVYDVSSGIMHPFEFYAVNF
jgi:hypothetical protein